MHQSRFTDKTGYGNNEIRQSTNKWIDHNDPKFRCRYKNKKYLMVWYHEMNSGWNMIYFMETIQYTI